MEYPLKNYGDFFVPGYSNIQLKWLLYFLCYWFTLGLLLVYSSFRKAPFSKRRVKQNQSVSNPQVEQFQTGTDFLSGKDQMQIGELKMIGE